jgi:hypothetical protein
MPIKFISGRPAKKSKSRRPTKKSKSRRPTKKSKSRRPTKKSRIIEKIGYKIKPTTIPVTKEFPPTWEIKFFRDLDEKEQVDCVEQLYNRGKETDNCNAFKDMNNIHILSRLRLSALYENFMMVYDNEILNGDLIGLIGFIWYDSKFDNTEIYIDKTTNMIYLVINTIWSCSFTTYKDFKDHYASKKRDYEISVARYLKIQLLDRLKKLAKVHKIDDYSIDYIMTYGCSLHTAIERHEKNGAIRMTDEELENFKPVNDRYKSSKLLKGKSYLKYMCQDDIPMYWVIPIVKI